MEKMLIFIWCVIGFCGLVLFYMLWSICKTHFENVRQQRFLKEFNELLYDLKLLKTPEEFARFVEVAQNFLERSKKSPDSWWFRNTLAFHTFNKANKYSINKNETLSNFTQRIVHERYGINDHGAAGTGISNQISF